MGICMLTCLEGDTDSFVQEWIANPHNTTAKSYIVESCINLKEIEGTTAESLDL